MRNIQLHACTCTGFVFNQSERSTWKLKRHVFAWILISASPRINKLLTKTLFFRSTFGKFQWSAFPIFFIEVSTTSFPTKAPEVLAEVRKWRFSRLCCWNILDLHRCIYILVCGWKQNEYFAIGLPFQFVILLFVPI